MRILIVGAGIAGLTLAAKLTRDGHGVTVVERTPTFTESGYGLGLYRPGSRVLEDLGVYSDFLAAGRVIDRYMICDENGDAMQALSMDVTPAHINPFVMIARTHLVRILASACGDAEFRMGTSVLSAREGDGGVVVELLDGSRVDADVLVAADGRSSGKPWSPFRPRVVDSKWIYWTWWGPENLVDSRALVDFCGRGWFLGAYPVPGRCMFGAGLPPGRTGQGGTTAQIRAAVHEALGPLTARRPEFGAAADAADRFYPWLMRDVTHRRWAVGRMALCGDAAAASIPTAGVGASHAIQGALALADELSRTGDPRNVPAALERYERRCRKAVNSNLRQSRMVARYMFSRSYPAVRVRDFLIRRYPAERVIRTLTKSVTRHF